MFIFKFIRFLAALSAFCFITIPCASLALLSALFKRPWLQAPVVWGRWVSAVSGSIAGVRVRYSGRRWKPSRFDHPILVIANHPPQVGLPFLYDAIYRLTGREVVSVVAKETLNPIFRWPLQAIGLVTCIKREDRRGALGRITQSIGGAASVALIFPDQTRYSAATAREQLTKYGHSMPDFAPMLEYVLVPKTGGLRALLTKLPEDAIVMDVTLALSKDGWSDTTSVNWVGATLAVHADYFYVRELPLQEAELRAWLMSRWHKKAQMIASVCASNADQ